MKKLVFMLSVGMLIISQLRAQTDTLPQNLYDLSLEDLMDISVVSASRTAEKSSEAPSTIYAVSKEQIEMRGYTTLDELLEDIPEIEIQHKSVGESSNYFSFRGLAGNEKFLVLQNGVRIASVTGTPHAILHNYPVSHAERVEVILGPASALYGADAFTGIVNIITQKGEDIKGGTLSTSYGSFNTTDNSFVVGAGNNDVAVMVTGSYFHSNEPFMPDYYKNEYSWYTNNYSTNGQLLLSPNQQDTVYSQILDYETPTDAYFANIQVKLKNVEIGIIRNFESHNSSSCGGQPEYNIYEKNAKFDVSNQIVYLQHNFESKDEKFSVQTTMSNATYELSKNSAFDNTFTNYKLGYKYANSNIAKLDEKITYSINDNMKLMGGLSMSHTSALPKSGDLPFKYDPDKPGDLQDIYYIGTNITDSTGKDLTVNQSFYNTQYDNYGGYLQYQAKFTDNIKFVAGGRFDYNTRYSYTINPRAGLVLNPISKLNVKVLYGRAYLAPSPYKTYQHFGSFVFVDSLNDLVGPFWHLTNPDLDPEIVNTFEASFGYYINDNIGIFSDGYYNKASNLIVDPGIGSTVFQGKDVGFAVRPENSGSAKTYGGTFRINGNYKLSNNSKLSGYLAYSYSDGKIDDGELTYSAKNTIKFGVDVDMNRFTVSTRGIYRGVSKSPRLLDKKNIESDSYLLLNLYAKYRIANTEKFKIDLFVKGSNLLNKRYFNISYGGASLFALSPQDPIRIMGGISIKM